MNAAARPITDSPWFWICLFAAAGCISLAAIGPKYASRQAQIEREFQGRQRAAQNAQGQQPSLPLSTPERTVITLQPLVWVLAVSIAAGWFLLWWHRTGLQRHPPGD